MLVVRAVVEAEWQVGRVMEAYGTQCGGEKKCVYV